jgi:hypothetical protein
MTKKTRVIALEESLSLILTPVNAKIRTKLVR